MQLRSYELEVDEETRDLIALCRQNVKSQIRQFRTTLALLSELESRLDRIAEGGIATNGNQDTSSLY